jgi:hypothetical protein
MQRVIRIAPGLSPIERLRWMIKAFRDAIRTHRDARGDDRCWLDDYRLWSLLPNTPSLTKPTPQEGMQRCLEFYRHRRAEEPDPLPPEDALDPSLWDADLEQPGVDLARIWCELVKAIRAHRVLPPDTVRTLEHDRRLYRVLPEKLPADFRLPPKEEFLGVSANPRASCPNFWASHSACEAAECNLHAWGPCGSGDKH